MTTDYPGVHVMAAATLTGHGDSDVPELLSAAVSPDRVAPAGLHAWTRTTSRTSPSGHHLVQPRRLTRAQVRRIVADVDAAAGVAGFTIAEFFPRQVMHLQQILDGFPLISRTASEVNRTSGDASSSAFTLDKASFVSMGVRRSVGEPCIPGLYCLPLIGDLPTQCHRRICAIGQRESEPPFEPATFPHSGTVSKASS